MKRKLSRLAMASLILGGVGFFLEWTHLRWFPPIPLLFGLAAIGSGGSAFRSIRRAPGVKRGVPLALVGAGLGSVAILISVGIILQGINRDRWRQQAMDRAVQLQVAMSVNHMPEESATNFTSDLPIILLHTRGQGISKEAPTLVRAEFFDTGNQRASLAAKADYEGLGTIHLRGYSSLHLPKQSYTFHTLDHQTNQTKVSLLGLPKEEDWVLYAPFEDKTLIRDVLAFELTGQMGHYAPRTRYVELFLHDSDRPLAMKDYAGVYVLVEKIKRGPERVNIAKLDAQSRSEPEISGGYIVKRDHSDREGARFGTSHGGPYFYVYPKPEDITGEQKAWLRQYFNTFENALYGADFKDPQKGYATYLDVDSFIDAHWLIEAAKNVDGFRYSAFITKDRGGKLKTEPPWDWNRSFGNADYYDGWQSPGWYWSKLRPNEISWYLRLREDPAFEQRRVARWLELRKSVFNPARIKARIDELAARLEEAQRRNFKRWPVLGQKVTCNFYVGQTYEDEVNWLKIWIEQRIAWIDSQVGSLPKS